MLSAALPSIFAVKLARRASPSSVRLMSTKTKLTKPITFVTGNENKLREVSAILGNTIPITRTDVDLPELQGNPSEVAIEKCKIAASKIDGPVMVEDTSLCFVALGGLPGPYIKWFLESCGHVGLNKMLDGFDDRSAYAQCIFAFTPGGGVEPIVFEGRTNGTIVAARAGTGPLFGWDPIFEPSAADQLPGVSSPQTYAEMDKTHKNSISHRFRSLNALREYLLAHYDLPKSN